MNDDELRSLIRAAIQRHTGGGEAAESTAGTISGASGFSRIVPVVSPPLSISFGQYRLERTDDDTSCLIEPAVQCNHCGFCKCHGH